MSGPDVDIAEIFRDEATERLDRMVTMLLALEAGDAPTDAIDSIFRDAHSIKGSAGMIGLDEVQVLAHSMEDRLGRAREEGSISVALNATLLSETDELRRLACGQRNPEPAPTPVSVPVPKPPAPADGGHAGVSAPPRRAEARSIRMPAAKVDRLLDAVGESVVQTRRLEHVLGTSKVGERDERTDWELGRGNALLGELQRAAIDMRTLPIDSITSGYARAVRDLAVAEDKEVSLEMSGTETQLDRVILEGLGDSIAHMLRNSIAHGIESPEERERAGKPRAGRITLRAEQRGSLVAVELADDGRGVDASLLERGEEAGSLAAVLSEAGLSTAAEVTEVAGRGVGLDAVRSYVQSFAGSLEVESEPGSGTVVTLLLPYSVALMRVLLIERGGQIFGLPLSSVEEVTFIERPLALGGSQAIEVRGHAVPLCDLAVALGADAPPLGARSRAVIVFSSRQRQAIACERILGEQELIVKSLGALLAGLPGYLGAAIVDSGAIAPILDPAFLTRRVTGAAALNAEPGSEPIAPKVLVVDDQFTVRELQRSILEAAGYRVHTARDGRDACSQIANEPDIELVVTDVDMPEMDGIELLETIRQDAHHPSLPVIVLTSMAREEDKRRGAEAGADAYLVKDEFDQRTLLDTVERLLVR